MYNIQGEPMTLANQKAYVRLQQRTLHELIAHNEGVDPWYVAELASCVRNGLMHLDAVHVEDFRDHIDLDELDMTDARWCVIGQIDRGARSSFRQMLDFINEQHDTYYAPLLGFDVEEEYGYAVLDALWREVIQTT